jgi:hypothetical protein
LRFQPVNATYHLGEETVLHEVREKFSGDVVLADDLGVY